MSAFSQTSLLYPRKRAFRGADEKSAKGQLWTAALMRAGLTLTVMLVFYSQIVFAISLSRSEVLTHNYQEYRKSLGSLLLRDCTSEQRRRPPQF
jgi:hypothetical protein